MGTKASRLQTGEEPLNSAATEPSTEGRRQRVYDAPELHVLGSLRQLRAVGRYWHDGSRYKDRR